MEHIIKVIICILLCSEYTSSQTLDPVINVSIDNYYYGKDYCKSIDSLITLAQARSLEEEELELYGLKALCFSSSSETDSIKYFLSKVKAGRSPRAKGLISSIEGYLLLGTEEDELAIQSFSKAIELYDQVRDAELITLTQLAIAWAHYGIFSFDNSIKYGQIGLDWAKRSNNKYNIIEGLDILANSNLQLGNSVIADSFFQEYLLISRSIDNPLVSYWTNTSAGHNFVSLNEYDSAHFYFQQSYNAAVSLQDSSLQRESLLYQGENAQMNGNSDLAISYLQKADSFPDIYRKSTLDKRLNEYLAEAFSSQGDYEKAFYHLNKYKEIDDKYWTDESRELALDFEAKYQSLQKDNEITRQELKITKRTSERNIILGGLGVAGIVMWFLIYRNRKNKGLSKSKIENLEKQQKLMALDYMVQGQEEERRRIAQDLHDGLGGLLTTAQLQIQNIQYEINKLGELNLLNKAETIINNACHEVRRISHDMRPAALIDLGLIDALDDLTSKLSSDHSLKISIIDQTEKISLDDNQKVQLYRICQELLNNTAKHARATTVTIIFDKKDHHIHMIYRDDGKGFDIDKALFKGGIGLQNIKSRVQYLDGSVDIKSKVGAGCTYDISVPINC